MDRDLHHQTVQQALALGRSTDPATLPEVIQLLRFPSTEVRRLAASAIAKLAPFGADPATGIPSPLHHHHLQKTVKIRIQSQHRMRKAGRVHPPA